MRIMEHRYSITDSIHLINLHICSQLIFNKGAKAMQWGNGSLCIEYDVLEEA